MFYDQFHRLCLVKGVTPTQVARDLGLRQSTVSMWKKQGTTPKYDTLRKLADYFGVDVDDLLVENWGIKAGGKIKAGGSIKSRYGIEADGGVEAGGSVEVGPGVLEDSFEEGLKKVSKAAQSALEIPKIASTKEKLSHIVEELSYEELEALVKFAQFTKYQREQPEQPETAPQSNERKSSPVDTPTPQNPAEGPQKPEEGE